MDLVDSQVHLWGADSPDRPWPPGRAQDAQKPYPITKEALLFQMDLAGVRRAVLVPPSWEGDRNDLALDAARTYPDRFAVMGRLALQDPASQAKLPDWRQQPGMLGLRFTFHNEHYRPFLTDGTADWLWPAAERAGINDGAAAAVLMSATKARTLGVAPRLRMVGRAEAGVDPALMDSGPIPATRRALAKTGMTLDQLDVIELNEAFASVALACSSALGLDPGRTNPNGGAVALGHPVGATGAILTVKLLYELERSEGQFGLVTLCIGGGQGIATIFERL
jgi:acetyl-CoA acetyltransferase